MVGSCNENKENGSLLKQATSQGKMNLGGRKISGMENRQIRRPLSLINQNKVGGGGGGIQQNSLGVNKRSVCGISGRIPPPRPNTRNFSAQIASSKPLVSPQEIKISEDSFCIWEDSPVTDVEEHVEAKDQPEPMSLEKRKEKSHENDQMEVEMEDIFEEPVVDIDIGDAKNPLAVIEYVEDLYAYYKNVEGSSSVSLNYMDNQFDINANMRGVLVDWLVEVNHKFELRAETLFLNVNLIDRFLEKQCVERKRLQLVGLVAMLLACKYEEVSVPVLDDLVFISDKAYTRKDIIEMEALMLNTLQFNMSVPTAFVFMKRYLKAAQSDKKLELLSFFLIELCLVEYEMIKFQPSFLAAAAIYAAQCTLYGHGQWDKTCEFHTNYSEEELLECARMIASFHQKAANGKLTGVHRKYRTSKFGYASMCEPAKFLIEEQTHIRVRHNDTHIRVTHLCAIEALYDEK